MCFCSCGVLRSMGPGSNGFLFKTCMATSVGKSKSVVLHEIYGRLNMHIVRANSTAILSRGIPLESL